MKRITSTSPAEIIQLAATRSQEYAKRQEEIEKAEAFVTENNRNLELMKKREFKTPGVGLERRQEALLTFKSKVLVPYQCSAIIKEITKSSQMRNFVTSFILKTPVSSPVEYIFLADIVDRLRRAIKPKEGFPDNVLQIDGVVEYNGKRLEKFLQDKKNYLATRSVKGDSYQADIKAKLKMISMIGGQVYKRITEKNKAKAK